jgi:glycosyltransferase involved in cell wall biosynthesis
MFKVVCVVDKKDTAIDRLAKGNAKYLDSIEFVICDVHPKRPEPEQLARFENEAKNADIIDFQYFRTAEMLKNKYEWLVDKKQILAHHNPYSITESNWNDYDLILCNNSTIKKNLESITKRPIELIGNAVDTEFWTFNDNYPPEKNRVIMVANRIESKKGILPVAIACGELGIKLVLVGSISDMDYFKAIEATSALEFHEKITDEELRKLYWTSTLHVCNSVDNFESGTNPMLEAMLCGCPVLTRNIGHVPDLNSNDNLKIFNSDNEDIQGLMVAIEELLYAKKDLTAKTLCEDMRQSAWNAAKNRSFERRAYSYMKAYRQVMFPESTSVSVITPVFDRPEVVRKCLDAIAEQTYKNIELIVADDSGENRQLVKDFATYVNFPIKYIDTHQGDYGLSRARNMATIEATGEIIVYCDQRIIMDSEAIEKFVNKIRPKAWLYGDKGAKKEFVENFSCVYRKEVIECGLFSERMDAYGGISQELRSRIRAQGFLTEYIADAKAVPVGKSSNKYRKRADIIKIKNRLWKMNLQ